MFIDTMYVSWLETYLNGTVTVMCLFCNVKDFSYKKNIDLVWEIDTLSGETTLSKLLMSPSKKRSTLKEKNLLPSF